MNNLLNIEIRDLEVMSSPIFIIGVPRSGTTWVQRILMSHAHVCSGQESKFFSTFRSALNYFFYTKQSQRKAGLYWYWHEEDFKREIVQLWYKTMYSTVKSHPQASLLVEKTPDHCICIPEIIELLPKSKFIHVIRDSRSVVASLLAASKTEWGFHWAPRTVKEASLYWLQRISKAQKDSHLLDQSNYIEVFYEDLIVNPERHARALFDFSGISVTEHELREIVQSKKFSEIEDSKSKSGLEEFNNPLENEPKGFFRKGTSDSWKQDLNLIQQLTVWRYTRKKMKQCGYNWKGRV